MPRASFGEIWVRFVHHTWNHGAKWRTDIQSTVLNANDLTTALFVLDDKSCIFVPMIELRRILSTEALGNNGAVTFDVNPDDNSINCKKVKMGIIRPQDRQSERRKNIEKLIDQL